MVLVLWCGPFEFSNNLNEEERAVCFHCGSVSLPHGAVCWSAVCDCVILTYFLTLYNHLFIYEIYFTWFGSMKVKS